MIFFQWQQCAINSDQPSKNNSIEFGKGIELFCLPKHNNFCKLKFSSLDPCNESSLVTTEGNQEVPEGPELLEKIFSEYKNCVIPDVHCICIVQKIDHWEIMCGHSNAYSLWRVKLEDLNIGLSENSYQRSGFLIKESKTSHWFHDFK